ncbi:MAG: type II toxin-antitoxin system RelE family toxin [Candidatus Entotheonellia bacterium]
MAYRIDYTSESVEHLVFLTARQRSIVFDSLDEQLTTEPMVATRNRKPMHPNPLATWELRLGNLRVYYDVEEAPEPLVRVAAVGVKRGNQVYIGGERYPL